MSVGNNLKDSRIAVKNAEIFTEGECRLLPLKGSQSGICVSLPRCSSADRVHQYRCNTAHKFVAAKAMRFKFFLIASLN